MKAQRPTAREIERLLAFLPRLTAEGFTPIREWGGGEKNPNGAYVMPWPVYDEVVKEFFESAGQDCWMDFDYVPIEAGRLLEDEARVRGASLDEIRTMLTYCVRGRAVLRGALGRDDRAGIRAQVARAVGGVAGPEALRGVARLREPYDGCQQQGAEAEQQQ